MMPFSHASPPSPASSVFGNGADADDQQVRLEGAAVRADDPLHRPAPFEPYHPGVADHLDPVSAMLVREIFRYAGRHDAIHHPVGHLEHRDRAAELAGRRRGFEADVAAADDDHPRAGLQPRAHGVHIGDAAQVMHAGELRARGRSDARDRAPVQSISRS